MSNPDLEFVPLHRDRRGQPCGSYPDHAGRASTASKAGLDGRQRAVDLDSVGLPIGPVRASRRAATLPLLIATLALLAIAACGGPSEPTERPEGPPITAENAGSIVEQPPIPNRVGWVGALDVSPDGQMIAVGDEGGGVQVWDVASGDRLAQVGGVRDAAFSPSGQELATSGFPGVQRWSMPRGEPLDTYRGHQDWVNALAYAREPNLILSGSGGARGGQSARLWDPATGETRWSEDWDATIRSVALTPDASLAAWGDTVGHIEVVASGARESVASIDSEAGNVTALDFGPSAERLASAHADGTARLWSARGGQALGVYEGGEWIEDLQWSPEGSLIAIGDRQGRLRILSAEDLSLLAEREMPHIDGPEETTPRIMRLAWQPEARWLVAGLSDGSVRVFGLAVEGSETP